MASLTNACDRPRTDAEYVLGPDYISECSKCDGSMCDGNCDVANLHKLENFEHAPAEHLPSGSTAGPEDTPSKEISGSRELQSHQSGGGPGEHEIWEIVDDILSENEYIIATPPWPLPAAMDPFNLYPNDRRTDVVAHSAEGQWEILKQLAIDEGKRQAAAPSTAGVTRSGSTPAPDLSRGGCVAFSNEPNTSVGLLLDAATWQRLANHGTGLLGLPTIWGSDSTVSRPSSACAARTGSTSTFGRPGYCPSTCDGSRILVGALAKWRSGSMVLDELLRKIHCICFAGDLQLQLLYIPSEHGPSDFPSRGVRLLGRKVRVTAPSRCPACGAPAEDHPEMSHGICVEGPFLVVNTAFGSRT